MAGKTRLALIGTYPEMSDLFLAIVRSYENIEAISLHASFEEAVERARQLEPRLDAILSRGATAEYIRKAVDVPVVFIPISPFDIVKALHRLPPGIQEVAVVHYEKNVLNVSEIADLYGIRIHEYLFRDYADIESGLKDAYEKGVRTVIGGEVTSSTAQAMGMHSVVVSSGYVAVSNAIEEALQIIEEKRKAENAAAQISAAFSSLTEGVVVLNADGRVSIVNQAALRVFGKKYAPGDIAGADIMDSACKSLFSSGEKAVERSEVSNIRGKTYVCDYVPVMRRSRFIGVVARYTDVSKVVALEQQVRQKTHAKGFVAKRSFSDIIGSSEVMERAKEEARLYAGTDASLLIEGESGTGKEFFAQSIHNESARREGPFVAVNCTAIPENLLESELFGYAPGAFTGAKREGKAGLFEMAHGGTIFLDEIGEMPPQIQTRLLRVLQEREVMRVGGSKVIPVDVRVISATNKNLWKMSQEGEFRFDLYYRLNVFYLRVPPLREREGDLVILATNFAHARGVELDSSFFKTIIPILEHYAWPGNVRELESVIERYSILNGIHSFASIDTVQLKKILGLNELEQSREGSQQPVDRDASLKAMVSKFERDIILHTLEECGNNHQAAAERLGIGKTTLWRKAQGGEGR